VITLKKKSNDDDKFHIPNCTVCGVTFSNIFEAVNHLVEDDGEQLFDPSFTLPNGYSLLLGSLLHELYDNAEDPVRIRQITEMTYATLYAGETDPGEMKRLVEEAIVHTYMSSIDVELEELLEEGE
jgi:hypothetical protein